jgi:DNA-binding CsgD family transcriptional regulator
VPLNARREEFAVVDPVESRIARLTEGQRQCLALVDQHLSSKEIAVRLGISPHTVDQRIRQALQILGVERRGEAARLIANATAEGTAPYQRLIHQSPHIDATPPPRHEEGAVSHLIRHADRAGGISSSGVISEQKPAGRWLPLQMPFATRNQPSNEMSVAARLLWIVLIAFGAAFSAGMYLAGLESLSRMIAS